MARREWKQYDRLFNIELMNKNEDFACVVEIYYEGKIRFLVIECIKLPKKETTRFTGQQRDLTSQGWMRYSTFVLENRLDIIARFSIFVLGLALHVLLIVISLYLQSIWLLPVWFPWVAWILGIFIIYYFWREATS